MEVHSHSHNHGDKNWKTYFWEFIMLFLAVFSGFLAENYREHFVEHEREKQYMESMIEDLKMDTARISKMIFDSDKNLIRIDSLIHLFRRKDYNQYGQTMYYFARDITATASRFELEDRTYEQMKSSGSLRLISNAMVSDSVSKYYSEQSTFKQQEEIQVYRMNLYSDLAGRVFDAAVFQEMVQKFPYKVHPPLGNPQLLTSDRVIINEYLGRLHYFFAIVAINCSSVKRKKNATLRLIQLLQNKYRLD